MLVKKVFKFIRSLLRKSSDTSNVSSLNVVTNLPDLPAEILLQILFYLVAPVSLSHQPFWLPDISNTMEQKMQRGEQVWVARTLSMVCQRTRRVFLTLLWSWFDCSSAVAVRNLRNACTSERELGGHIHLSCQFAAVWLKLTSLRSLSLTLSHKRPCHQWLADQLRDIPTLRSLRLRIYGSGLGPHLRALPQLEMLSVEIHPPSVDDLTPKTRRCDWIGLFNDVIDMIDACVKDGNVKSLGLFINTTIVASFYRHVGKSSSLSSLSAPVLILDTDSSIIPAPPTKKLSPSNLSGLTRLSITLRSQMGTESFLQAMGGLPITDLALHLNDLNLFSGTAFRDFCFMFERLRRLRLKLENPPIPAGGRATVMEGLVDQDALVQGLASLRHLEAFKGPVLFRRQTATGSSYDIARGRLDEVVLALKASGMLNPDLLLQWHLCFDEGNGPKQLEVVPAEPVRLGDWKFALTRVRIRLLKRDQSVP
ncbi:hypothetical protein BDV93DRAFT_504569 [Ceratobasidium sp. AG-I]|nr:hypothetical protein BDV93DRAFT_504569 [Ceratobasidium sp. AG-I]